MACPSILHNPKTPFIEPLLAYIDKILIEPYSIILIGFPTFRRNIGLKGDFYDELI
jgi:hypothetical protein